MKTTHKLFDELEATCARVDATDLLRAYRNSAERDAFLGGVVMGMAFGMLLLGIFRVIITA